MKKNRAHWTVFESTGIGPSQLWCKRCGAKEQVDLPMAVSKFCKQTNAFVRAHSMCVEPAEASQSVRS